MANLKLGAAVERPTVDIPTRTTAGNITWKTYELKLPEEMSFEEFRELKPCWPPIVQYLIEDMGGEEIKDETIRAARPAVEKAVTVILRECPPRVIDGLGDIQRLQIAGHFLVETGQLEEWAKRLAKMRAEQEKSTKRTGSGSSSGSRRRTAATRKAG